MEADRMNDNAAKMAMQNLNEHEHDFIDKCIKLREMERLSLEQVLEHPHFATIRERSKAKDTIKQFTKHCAELFYRQENQKLTMWRNDIVLRQQLGQQNAVNYNVASTSNAIDMVLI